MNKLTTKWFKKWAKRNKLNNQTLIDAIQNLESGLSSVDLGQHLFKVRVRRENAGKSSGYRTIILYKKHDKAVFIHGFGKNEKGNIDQQEFQYFKKLGQTLMAMNPKQVEMAIKDKILFSLEDEK